MIFLTDGRTFIGPYDPETEPITIGRDARTLRENHGADEVFRVTANSLEEAKRAYAAADRAGATS